MVSWSWLKAPEEVLIVDVEAATLASQHVQPGLVQVKRLQPLDAGARLEDALLALHIHLRGLVVFAAWGVVLLNNGVDRVL